jgi:hypothetical protein
MKYIRITVQDIKAAVMKQVHRTVLEPLEQYRNDTGFDQAGAATMRRELPAFMEWLDANVKVGTPMPMYCEDRRPMILTMKVLLDFTDSQVVKGTLLPGSAPVACYNEGAPGLDYLAVSDVRVYGTPDGDIVVFLTELASAQTLGLDVVCAFLRRQLPKNLPLFIKAPQSDFPRAVLDCVVPLGENQVVLSPFPHDQVMDALVKQVGQG